MSKISLHKRRETRDCETRDGSLSLSKGPCPEVPRPVSIDYAH